MKIGFVQTEPAFGEIQDNIQQVRALLADQQADLWVLPELFATGYQFVSRDEAYDLAEDAAHGPTAAALAEWSADRGAYFVGGLPERGEHDRLYNTAILVGPDGVLARYRKIHLFAEETRWFHPGAERFPVAELGDARVGLMICFDHLFPESARTLALAGAEIIAHPSNLVMPVYAQVTMRARALENGVFTVTANRVGTEHRGNTALTYTGHSQIVAPDGEILAQAPAQGTAVEAVTVDPGKARDKRLNPYNDRLGDRRPELYAL
jgi:predicted amidohydrolase